MRKRSARVEYGQGSRLPVKDSGLELMHWEALQGFYGSICQSRLGTGLEEPEDRRVIPAGDAVGLGRL